MSSTRQDSSIFFDDFSDSIWTKYSGNPVMVRDQLWAESDYICEPNVLYEDGIFHMWFSQMWPKNKVTALGYATSSDGFTWTKYPKNPVLALDNVEIHRPSVMKHAGKFYLFAVQDEYQKKKPSTMRRWVSSNGIKWGDECVVLRSTESWENGLSNMAVIVDDNGTWQMLYNGTPTRSFDPNPDFGYAYSEDGVEWTKYEGNPVIQGFFGGDPFLVKIGDRYYTWHSHRMVDSLRIYCRWSTDMIHWQPIYNNPQINYTQPWERGIPAEEGGATDGSYGHLSDATLCEAQGKVFFIYQGAQTPLGVATFDGTLVELAEHLHKPPLSKWKESPYGMVEGGTLKIADNGTDRSPLVAEIPVVKDHYVLESRIQCYGGVTHRVSVVMRYGNNNLFARFWLYDAEHTFYQEYIYGLFSSPINIGPNNACDAAWHDWTVEVNGERNRLSIDGHPVGECRTSTALLHALSSLFRHIGFSSLDTYVSIKYVRVVSPCMDLQE